MLREGRLWRLSTGRGIGMREGLKRNGWAVGMEMEGLQEKLSSEYGIECYGGR